jgi:parallel beta-helix repeat protein
VIDRNDASGNGDDGIDVRTTSATIAKNIALGNGDLGIEAPDGVVDGGGNIAAGNADPDQCTGVDCEPPAE